MRSVHHEVEDMAWYAVRDRVQDEVLEWVRVRVGVEFWNQVCESVEGPIRSRVREEVDSHA